MRKILFLLLLLPTLVSGQFDFYAKALQQAGCDYPPTTLNATNRCDDTDATTGWQNNNGAYIEMTSKSDNSDTDDTYHLNMLMDQVTAANRNIQLDLAGVENGEDYTVYIRVSVTQGTDFRPRLPSGSGWSSTVTGSNFSGSSYTTYTINGTANADDANLEIQCENGYSLNDELDIAWVYYVKTN